MTAASYKKEDAASSLAHILGFIEQGKDCTGMVRRFLCAWNKGDSLAEIELSPGLDFYTGFCIANLYGYIAANDATVRPISFGKGDAVKRLCC